MGQFFSAAVACISNLTGGRRQGSLRLTGRDEEAAPAAGTSMPAVAQATGPKPIYIAYVAISYPCCAIIPMVTSGSWVLPGAENQRSVNQLTQPTSHSLTACLQFVNLVSGSSLGVGQGLESCTSEVQTSTPFSVGEKQVILIDTPGFGDTTLTDSDIWKIIAASFVTR